MATPAELREQSRRYREAAAQERTPQLRQYLANHAFALAQLAEQIERAQVGGGAPVAAKS